MPYPTKFEVGKTYEIHHSRKGPMTIKVENIGEFTDCTIVSGHAKAMNGGAVAVAGEALTFRTSLATIVREVVSA